MKIEYTDKGKFAWYKGVKFTRDEKTGYYLNSTLRKRLHRYVYEKEIGTLPKGRGFNIHHKDGDKKNNDISNLELMTNSKHQKEHGEKKAKENPDFFVNFQKKGIAAAPEWHRSKEGRKWHAEHYENNIKNIMQETEIRNCLNCNKEFEAKKHFKGKYCTNSCKTKYRRKNKLDNINKNCSVCGKMFNSNKYDKTETCSNECKRIKFKASRGF